MAKPSTCIIITLAAINIFTEAVRQRLNDDHGYGKNRLCKPEGVAPAGSYLFRISFSWASDNEASDQKISFMLASLNIHIIAETAERLQLWPRWQHPCGSLQRKGCQVRYSVPWLPADSQRGNGIPKPAQDTAQYIVVVSPGKWPRNRIIR